MVEVMWDFGDGTTSTEEDPNYTYDTPGNYTATVTITDEDGDTDTATIDIEVIADISPTVTATATPNSGFEPLVVQFDATVTGGNGMLEVMWDFGDGNTSTQEDPNYTYDTPGFYTATVTVTDEDGDTGMATVEIEVITARECWFDSECLISELCQLETYTCVDIVPSDALFAASGQRLAVSSPKTSFNLAMGDLDGDRDLDLFLTNYNDNPNEVWLNDGRGVFISSSQDLGESSSYGVDLGDLDGDGDIDAFVANRFENPANRVWLNDGTGTFTGSGQELGDSESYEVDLGDLDGDGDLDAFIANYREPNRVWLNDGTGTFTDSGQELGDADSTEVDLGDLDGDGDLDAFISNFNNQPNQVYLNDGTGTFTDSGQALGEMSNLSAALGDIDEDGDLDAFVANRARPNAVWLNDGTGTFTDSGQVLGGNDYSSHVALGDLDGDGDLDAFIANSIFTGNHIWLNDGEGIFTMSPNSTANYGSFDVELGDVDADGDLDVAFANSNSNRTVLWNHIGTVPRVTFQYNGGTVGVAPFVLEFDATVTGGDAPLELMWEFGDGATSTEEDPTHTYTVPGSYTAALFITDADGDVTRHSVDVKVAVDLSPEITSAMATPTVGVAPQTVMFEATGGGGNLPTQVTWDFGDGNTSPIRSPTHIYTEPGSYTATAIATDTDGDITTVNIPIEIAPDAFPSMFASADPTVGSDPLTVSFNSEVAGGNGMLEVTWDFGDGNTSTEEDPTHIYTVPWTYTATAFVTDTDGDVSSDSVFITVEETPSNTLEVTATPDATSGLSPLTVEFDATTVGNDGAVTFLWNFGDGNTSTEEDPTHTYTDVGSYTITLTAVDDSTEDSTALIITVTDDLCISDSDCVVGQRCQLEGTFTCTDILPTEGTFYDSTQALVGEDSTDIAFGDLDGDGDLDAFVTNYNSQPNRVFLNAGNGNFIATGQTLGVNSSNGVALGDLDDDGDLDAFVINDSRPNSVYFNYGDGTFSTSTSEGGSTRRNDIELGDLDGDGDLDAVAIRPDRTSFVWLNDGSGDFSISPNRLNSAGFYSSYGLELRDLDSDGDLDIFVINNNQPAEVWLNDGNATFDDSEFDYGNTASRGLDMGDLDGDGDIDAFEANGFEQPNRVFLNDGDGTFIDSGQTLGLFDSRAVTLGDMDGDGDLDAFIVNSEQPNRVWLNDGTGTFTDSGYETDPVSDGRGGKLGDVDGDGDLDAFVVNYDAVNTVWFNGSLITRDINPIAIATATLGDGVGEALFSVTAQGGNGPLEVMWDFGDGNTSTEDNPTHTYTASGHYTAVVSVTDADSDVGMATASITVTTGECVFDTDCILGELCALATYTCEDILPTNAGFVDTLQVLGDATSIAVAVGDLDADQDLDTFVVNNYDSDIVWLNQGTGTFAQGQAIEGSGQRHDIALGDQDNDGDLDAFITRSSASDDIIRLNQGTGTFTDPAIALDGSNSRDVALGDLDDDGDLDAFVACSRQTSRVWLNNGDATFTQATQNLTSRSSTSVALGDLDDDGDLDAFVVNTLDQANSVFLNNGDGTFTDTDQTLGGDNSTSVALGDLDGDGDLDAFVTNNRAPNRVWLNNGTGTFTDAEQALGNYDSENVALGDLDGDGDLDAFVANDLHENAVWLNAGNGNFADIPLTFDNSFHYGEELALGDLDGDGALDVFIVHRNHGNNVWLNTD